MARVHVYVAMKKLKCLLILVTILATMAALAACKSVALDAPADLVKLVAEYLTRKVEA